MKTQIRFGTFETNSSSTHSLVVCTREEYNGWEKGDLLYNKETEEFVDRKTAILELRRRDQNKFKDGDYILYDEGLIDFDLWGEDYETETYSYKTKNGEELVIRCYYGYN